MSTTEMTTAPKSIGDETAPDETAPSDEREEARFNKHMKSLPHISDPHMLSDTAFTMLEMLLRRRYDEPLLRTLSEVMGEVISRIDFDGSTEEIRAATRQAARKCMTILKTAKEKRLPRSAIPDEDGEEGQEVEEGPASGANPHFDGEDKDVEYWLPPHLAHLLKRIEYTVPALPPPQANFADFDSLCEAAITRRIDKALVFFHRHNPAAIREIPPFFLASEEFAKKFHEEVRRFIYPQFRDSRQVRMLSTSLDLSKVDAENFWDHLMPELREKLLSVWEKAWDDLKLIEAEKEDGTKVAQIKETTKELRDMLKPSSPMAYDLPKIGNREIEVFKSLLDTSQDWWTSLNEHWRCFQDIYEQEKDPRIFQQQAREGALRDSLLAAFEGIPEQWCDFLVLLCHRVFPRINTAFLKAFVVNMGLTETERRRRAPYLMRYLEQVREHPDIKIREKREEAEREAEMAKLRSYLKGYDS